MNAQSGGSHNVATRDGVNSFIKNSLLDPKGLDGIKSNIALTFGKDLSDYDSAYIEEKYIEILVEEWIIEDCSFVVDIINPNSLLNIIDELINIDSCADCYRLIEKVNPVYTPLLIQLSDSSEKFKSEEKKYVSRFKSECLNLVLLSTDWIQDELQFLRCFSEAVNYTRDLDELWLALHIKQFVNGEVDFQNLLSKIQRCTLKNSKISLLKQTVDKLMGRNKYFFVDKLKESIKEYLKPVLMTVLELDGRSVLEVLGKHIVFSKVLKSVEKHSEFNDVEEVRFVSAEVIHADEDLEVLHWHGKNIVVYCDTLIVTEYRTVKWDVSGKDAEELDTEPVSAGQAGKQGESGGNVTVMASVVENAYNLQVLSNGGQGSQGQMGGKGDDGQDGAYIKEQDFKTKYPPVSKIIDSSKTENLIKTMKSISNCLKSVKRFSFGYSEVEEVSKENFEEIFLQCANDLKSCYFEVETTSGCVILFSFYEGSFWSLSPSQSFLLFKGAFGSEGKPGGMGGPGGKGGFAGEIDLQIPSVELIKLVRENGKDGKHGEIGTHGKPGKNGIDIAYSDCSVELFQFGKWPITHTVKPYDNMCLEPVYNNNNSSESVWSPHNSMYATIKPRPSQTVRSQQRYQQLRVYSQQPTQEHRLKVARKKTVNKESVKERYEQKTSIVDYLKLDAYIDKAKAQLEMYCNEETLDLEQVATEAKVVRLKKSNEASFFTEESSMNLDSDTYDDFQQEQPSVDYLIEMLKQSPYNVQILSTLEILSLNINQVNEIWNIVPSNSEFAGDVYIKLCLKYQLAVLRWLGTESSANPIMSSHKQNLEMFIQLRNTNSDLLTVDNNLEPYSEVEEFFCMDSVDKRKEVVGLCQAKLEDQTLTECLQIYLQEFGHRKGRDSILAKLKKELCLYEKDKLEGVQMAFIPLKNLLDKPKNKHLYKLLLDILVEGSNQGIINFERETSKDDLFKELYRLYVIKSNKHFDWNTLTEWDHLIDCFYEEVKNEGPRAGFYREFLAYHFQINILLYSMDESGQMLLVDNHNPKAKSAVHILKREDQFTRLNVNNELVKMIEKHKVQAEIYSQMLAHVDSLTKKEHFDEFVYTFKTNNYKGIDRSTKMQVKTKQVFQQVVDVSLITEFFLLEEKALIQDRLEKLKYQLSGCEDILYYMSLHFQSEGKRISAKEMCFIVNCILRVAAEGAYVLPLASWILATQPQPNWLAELTLLQLELFLKTPLREEQTIQWRQYLHQIKNKDTLMLFLEKISDDDCTMNEQCIKDTLYLLSRIPRAYIGLEKLDIKEWKFYLKDRFWVEEMSNISDWSQEDLKRASFHLVTMENIIGTEMCEKFIGCIKKRKHEIYDEDIRDALMDCLRIMSSQDTNVSNQLLETLSNSKILKWNDVLKKECGIVGGDRSLLDLVKLIKNPGNTSQGILEMLDHSKTCIEICDAIINKLKQQIDNDEEKLAKWISKLVKFIKENKNKKEIKDNKFTFFDTCKSLTKNIDDKLFETMFERIFPFISKTSSKAGDVKSTELLVTLLSEKGVGLNEILFATVVKAINLKFKVQLRPTQKLTIMTMLNSDKNVLGQVSTGEGKSFIVVALAIMKGVYGQKVDIITSSKVLAKRDADEYKDIYKLFGLNAGHNCSEDLEERKKEYSNKHVVYGELGNFQRDYLLDRFYNKNVLGDRSFETILVDEVDSMLLDKGNNMLYLSHDIPGLDKLQPLFLYIWKLLNLWVTDKSIETVTLKQSILYDLFGIIKQEHLKNLDRSISDTQVHNTWEGLLRLGVINSAGHTIKEDIDEKCLDQLYVEPDKYFVSKDHLKYFLKMVMEREKPVEIPNHLREFVEAHLEEWLESGQRALTMQNGVDYVVDVDRSGTSEDRSPNVTLIDRDTGTDLVNSQWDAGLHQFLQIKHGCRLSPLSLKAVFISNVTYFNQYKTLFGLSGTLGSLRERELLKEIYNVDFVTIPTAKPKVFIEEQQILCSSTEDWLQSIFEEVNDKTEHRSVLIICESVNDVMTLEQTFSKNRHSKKKLYVYKRDYENFKIADNLEPGIIILSTNLAGRGTDIKLSRRLVMAGGLHVVLSYLPNNTRVEEQAFGRAARNGEPGSARLIFHTSNWQNTAARVIDLKKQRNVDEILRIGDIKRYHDTCIKQEEDCFGKFQKIYSRLEKQIKPECVKLILLQVCLDKWAFWLDKHSSHLDSDSITSFLNEILKLGEDKFEIWSEQVTDPNHLIKLSLYYIDKKDYQSAKILLNRVSREESNFSEVARYYSVCAMTAIDGCKTEHLVNVLKTVGTQLNDRVQTLMLSTHLIDWLKERNPSSLLQIDSFKEQQRNTINTYEAFIQSVYNIVGGYITPQSLSVSLDIDVQLADDLYEDLLGEGVLIGPKIKPNIIGRELNFAKSYGVSTEALSTVLQKQMEGFNSKTLLEDLKALKLPSRELFWKELLLKKIIFEEEKYIFVDYDKLHNFDPSLHDSLKKTKQANPSAYDLWLYHPEEMAGREEQQVYKTSTVIDVIKSLNEIDEDTAKEKLKLLKRKSIMFANKQAVLNVQPRDDIVFDNFDSLCIDDFTKVNIPKDVAEQNIIPDLINKKVIRKVLENNSNTRKTYILLKKSHEIENIELCTHKTYVSDVQALITNCFAFRIALEEVVESAREENGPRLSLPVKIHRTIVNELYSRGVIEESVVDPSKEITKTLKKLYSSELTEQECRNIFQRLYCNVNSNKIVECIVQLVQQSYLTKQSSLADEIKKHFKVFEQKYYINLQPQSNTGNAHQRTAYNTDFFEKNKKSIMKILSDYYEISNLVSENILPKKLKSITGAIHSLDTPAFSFIPLLTVLENNNWPKTESSVFSLNGFDRVIIVEEKKFSKNMIISTVFLTLWALTEITGGIIIGVYNPALGSTLMFEGFSSVASVVQSLFTGFFSWKEFVANKTLSMLMSFMTSFGTIKKLFSRSPSAISSGLWANTKNVFQSVFGKTETKSTMITTIVKRVMISTTEAVGQGLIFASFDHFIKPHFENITESIINKITYTDINETISTHSVTRTIEGLFLKLDQRAAVTINSCLQKVIERHSKKTTTVWRRTISLFKTTINQCLKIFNHTKKTTHFSENKLETAIILAKAISNLQKLIESSQVLQVRLTAFVTDILNDLEKELNTKLRQINQKQIQKSPQEVERFTQSIHKKIEEEIRHITVTLVTENIVTPILYYTESRLISCSSEFMAKRYNSFFSDKEIDELARLRNLNKNGLTSNKKKKIPNRQNVVDIQHQKCVLSLLQRRRSAALYVEVLKKRAPMDMGCIEFCCTVIPQALRREGIYIPKLRVILKRNNEQYEWSTAPESANCLTIGFNCDADFVTNLRGNRPLVRNVIDSMYNAILNSNPEYRGYTSELLHELVIRAVENDFYIQEIINTFQSDSNNRPDPIIIGLNLIAEEVEPCEHSRPDEEWEFNPEVDIDLREKPSQKKRSCSISVSERILQGYKVALQKLNYHISFQSGVNFPLSLVLDDFEKKCYEIGPRMAKSTRGNFDCYVSQYSLVLPLLKDNDKFVNFRISMTLKRRMAKEPYCPRGPHIVYEVSPCTPRYINEGVHGHILLDSECQAVTHTIRDCHVAGEIILPNPNLRAATQRTADNCRRNRGSQAPVTEPTPRTADNCRRNRGSQAPVTEPTPRTADNCRRNRGSQAPVTEPTPRTADNCRRNRGSQAQMTQPTIVAVDNCHILILGDSMFDQLYKYLKHQRCVIRSFEDKKPSLLLNKISSKVKRHPNAKYVVLYFGMFVLKYKMSVMEIQDEIDKVIELIQGCLSEARIFLYSIALRKPGFQNMRNFSGNKSKWRQIKPREPLVQEVTTICKTICHLRAYCNKRGIAFIETNTLLQPEDLNEDGIHLNVNGYQKMCDCILRLL